MQLLCFYYVLTTFTTVGYGEILAAPRLGLESIQLDPIYRYFAITVNCHIDISLWPSVVLVSRVSTVYECMCTYVRTCASVCLCIPVRSRRLFNLIINFSSVCLRDFRVSAI